MRHKQHCTYPPREEKEARRGQRGSPAKSTRRFSLQSLLLVIALVAVLLAWWIDRSRKPEIYYVHLFVTHFVDMERRGDPKHPEYGMPVHLMTASIRSGTPFRVNIPHDYNPTIEMEGLISIRGDKCAGKFTVLLTAPDVADWNDRLTPLTIEKAQSLGDSRFQLVVSRSSDSSTCDVPWEK